MVLRRYFNSLYPLASAWLRNLAAKLPGLHFNTQSINPTRWSRSPRTPFIALSAPLGCPSPTWLFGLEHLLAPSHTDTAHHHAAQQSRLRLSLPLPVSCVQLSRSLRNDAVLPLVRSKSYWTFRGAHDSLTTHSPALTQPTVPSLEPSGADRLDPSATRCSTFAGTASASSHILHVLLSIDRREYKIAPACHLLH